ncbi:hypothetical protein [Aurantiacibacter gangjinensis]|uniref:hypothetical protein n=1 Tax=Aurantiacibacter gangjinensis TaxID=502682 RepID=UPI00090B36C5|nr:hypothetical protein [Aurantiacibacter gangjinensis]APE27308.1 hypothetical protein BMF35_a0479 [Aurantiacibacter gangjinensis]
MIDLFSIALSHGLILAAMWRVMMRPELDEEGAADSKPERPWLKKQQEPHGDA